MIFPELTAYSDWGLLALRITVGVIFIVHGWPKLTNARGMTQAFGQSNLALIAFFTALGAVETFGGIAMVIGLWTQPISIAFAIIMVGAIALKNTMMKTGFTAQNTAGWEFDFALLGATLALLLVGPGRLVVLA